MVAGKYVSGSFVLIVSKSKSKRVSRHVGFRKKEEDVVSYTGMGEGDISRNSTWKSWSAFGTGP